jgi:uncharacterized protein (TIGR02246 family)
MSDPDREVRSLYAKLIEGWNEADAVAMTQDFSEAAHMVGFDGTQRNGRDAIREHLAAVFASHQVAAFVTVVRELRHLTPDVAILRANAGMIPSGKTTINPATNAVQTLVAARHDGRWQVELFQNTPAAWHGRRDDADALTEELQAVFDSGC